jgi:hypothetical protein
MTTPRGGYVEWQTWPEWRRQRLTAWYDDLLALQSLLQLRLGLRHTSGSVFGVLLFNDWDTDGPWIPPGRLDLAGEYIEARLRGAAGSTQSDLLATLSCRRATPLPRSVNSPSTFTRCLRRISDS